MPRPRSNSHPDILHLVIPASSGENPSSSSELLVLAGTDYTRARLLARDGGGGFGRSVSGVSRSTTLSGDVQSVEAL